MRSSRPTDAGRLFRGRSAGAVPAFAGQIFSLCGFSHALAARLALSAAREAPEVLSPQTSAAITHGLLAERFIELLRSTTLGWPAPSDAQTPRDLGAMKRAFSAGRRLFELGRGEALGVDAGRSEGLRLVETLLGEMRALRPLLGALAAGFAAETAFDSLALDALSETDDRAVVAALSAEGASFAALPHLPGRRPETGAFARRGSGETGDLGEEFAAQLADLDAAVDGMQAGLNGAAEPGLFQAATLEDGRGYAAVETARGRLYHLARVEGALVTDYALVAPTEWNFHPKGPFAAMLTGARLEEAQDARMRIARLAALFDPCVACRIDVRDEHA